MGANDDLKAKMREALDKKKSASGGSGAGNGAQEKVHGSEVTDRAPKMHRRKSG